MKSRSFVWMPGVMAKSLMAVFMAVFVMVFSAGFETACAADSNLCARLNRLIEGKHVGVAVIDMGGRETVLGDSSCVDWGDAACFFDAVKVVRRYDVAALVDSVWTVGHSDLKRGVWSPLRAMTDSLPLKIAPVDLLDLGLNMNDRNVPGILRRHLSASGMGEGGDTGVSMSPIEGARAMRDFFVCDTTAGATLLKAVMARRTAFGNERIAAGIPSKSARVFHKTGTVANSSGEGIKMAGDMAMVFYPTSMGYGYYTIVVGCSDASMSVKEADRLIATISESVWQEFIVGESLCIEPTLMWREAPRRDNPGHSAENEGYTWGDFLIDTIFGIIDAGLDR